MDGSMTTRERVRFHLLRARARRAELIAEQESNPRSRNPILLARDDHHQAWDRCAAKFFWMSLRDPYALSPRHRLYGRRLDDA